jgi:hypothetical protein
MLAILFLGVSSREYDPVKVGISAFGEYGFVRASWALDKGRDHRRHHQDSMKIPLDARVDGYIGEQQVYGVNRRYDGLGIQSL